MSGYVKLYIYKKCKSDTSVFVFTSVFCFLFYSFFPSQLQPIVSIFANTIFFALVKIKLCKKPQRKYDVSSPSTITITLPGTDPQDAERRRYVIRKHSLLVQHDTQIFVILCFFFTMNNLGSRSYKCRSGSDQKYWS